MSAEPLRPLHIKGGRYYDDLSREVILRGINFAGDAKFPYHKGSESYVDSPVPLDQADDHLKRLRKLGFNCLRFVFVWDALENGGPGVYDEAYIDYAIEMLKKMRDHGFYVFMDPHQDVWSRFSGGSGAPLWTLFAAGFDPDYFEETHAAMLYNPESVHKVKMIWASNYHRLVSQTMFTLFFAGEQFAPKCRINGKNVGTYLQDHYMKALGHFMGRVRDADLGPFLLGWESMNEPGHGLIGYEDLEFHPDEHGHVKLGTAPSPFQAMLLGNGVTQVVDYFRFTPMGLRKEDTVTVAPKHTTWLSKQKLAAIDKKYGWKRSWDGGCIWELHRVYDKESQRLISPFYFTEGVPDTLPTENPFVQHYFTKHWNSYREMVESYSDTWWVFMQAPVNLPPPDFALTDYKLDLTRTVYTPHYYDGLTLMLKRWRWINVDAVGVCRNRYASPILAVKFGNKAIRNSFDNQLGFLRSEGWNRVGHIPCLMSEIGIPYDLDGKRAFDTGYYDDQVQAMDANNHALEANRMSHALWVYTCGNTHRYGDNWCGEDLSIWSQDDMENEVGYLEPTAAGVRAAPAVIRPVPVAVRDRANSYSFDIYKATFNLTLSAPGNKSKNSTIPTVVFLPKLYYHGDKPHNVTVSAGTFEVKGNYLYWYHPGGAHSITVKGSPRFADSPYSYVDPLLKLASNTAKEVGLFLRGSRSKSTAA